MRRSISHLPQGSALLVLTASLACSCVTAFAGEVGLAWDAKTEPEIVGYRIYYGVVSTGEVRSIDVGNVTTYRVTGLDPDSYHLCVTAYDLPGNETGCSNVVSITVLPKMYGFRDESGSSQPPFPAGPPLKNVTENRSSCSAQEDLIAYRFRPVAYRISLPASPL